MNPRHHEWLLDILLAVAIGLVLAFLLLTGLS